MTRSSRLFSVAFVGVLLLGSLTVLAPRAEGATFRVNTYVDDAPDGCSAEECTLREAVMEANATDGPDVIRLSLGTYQLTTSGGGEDAAATGDLDITDTVSIVGAGPATTIDQDTNDRVFDNFALDGAFLSKLTVQGGFLPTGGAGAGGGGIRSAGRLRLENVHVFDNSIGSGCCGGGVSSTGQLTIVNSKLSRNAAQGGKGGGIYAPGSRVTIRNTLFSRNRAPGCCGGAIYTDGGTDISIEDSELINNTAQSCCGGGVYAEGEGTTVRLERTLVQGNSADSCCGGGLYAGQGADLTILSSHVDHNHASSCCGGAVYAEHLGTRVLIARSTIDGNETTPSCCGGAFDVEQRATLTIRNSKVRGNASGHCCGGAISAGASTITIDNTLIAGNESPSGGAISIGGDPANPATLKITDSTLSGNSTSGDDPGPWDPVGGAIESRAQALTLINVTISGNTAGDTGGGIFEAGTGTVVLSHVTLTDNRSAIGGDGIQTDGGVTLRHSIIAGNGNDNCSGPLDTRGVSLDTDSTCAAGPSILDGSPRLGRLKANGGPTPTRMPAKDSPAVDAVPRKKCPPPARDQRGVKRPKDGDGSGSVRCDLGSVERKRPPAR